MTRTLIIFFLLQLPSVAKAEPWLATRFSQNCAACHAPGRLNREKKSRRCTLSCQGCHVNPNGSGLRNNYGKWNQSRWLRSFGMKSNPIHKKTPARFQKQPYVKLAKKKNFLPESVEPGTEYFVDKIDKLSSKQKKFLKKQKYKKTKSKLKQTSVMSPDEKKYSSDSSSNWRYKSLKLYEQEFYIPKDDPYWFKNKLFWSAGTDIRFLHYNLKNEFVSRSATGGMAIDLQFLVKPKSYPVKLVYEHRLLKNPEDELKTWFDDSITRSVYLLVDDQIYNSYIMFGSYMPLFGLVSPDHNSMRQQYVEFNQKTRYQTISIGTAPNVPFVNLHLIQGKDELLSNSGKIVSSKEKGFAVNLGMRFVKKGFSLTASYWKTRDEEGKEDRIIKSVDGGLRFGRYTLNAEYMNYFKENELVKNQGSLTQIQNKYRIWREVYLLLNYAESDTLTGFGEGTSSELLFGIKSFLWAGVEFEVSQSQNKQTPKETSFSAVTTDLLKAELHLYF